MIKMLKKNKMYFIFILLSITLFCLYVFLGLTAKNSYYFLPRRLVKILGMIIVVFAIGFSSLIFQTTTNNKILTPSIMGLDSVYLFLQTTIIFFFGGKSVFTQNDFVEYFITIILMVGFSLLLFLVMNKLLSRHLFILILIGTVISQIFSSFTSFMQVVMDPNEFTNLEANLIPSFEKMNTSLVFISLGIVLLIFVLSFKDLKKYDVLYLGIDQSINLGLNHKKEVLKVLIYSSILVAVATALVGQVTYIGLILVTLARYFAKSYKHSKILIMIFLVGFTLLVGTSFVIERLLKSTVTVNVVLNLVGGVIFFILLIKEKGKC